MGGRRALDTSDYFEDDNRRIEVTRVHSEGGAQAATAEVRDLLQICQENRLKSPSVHMKIFALIIL